MTTTSEEDRRRLRAFIDDPGMDPLSSGTRDIIDRLLREREQLAGRADVEALDKIAKLCGCPEWEYPGQVVRDVEALHENVGRLATELNETRDALRNLSSILDSPQTSDFLAAIPPEAAHQVKRWGVAHDAGKTNADWYWLVGYLAGKALHASVAGDVEKALHHTISSAAVLLNWHRALAGVDHRMRPGIAPPDETLPDAHCEHGSGVAETDPEACAECASLTEEHISELWREAKGTDFHVVMMRFARAVEAAARENPHRISYMWGLDEEDGTWWLVECKNGEPVRRCHPDQPGGWLRAYRDSFVRWHAMPEADAATPMGKPRYASYDSWVHTVGEKLRQAASCGEPELAHATEQILASWNMEAGVRSWCPWCAAPLADTGNHFDGRLCGTCHRPTIQALLAARTRAPVMIALQRLARDCIPCQSCGADPGVSPPSGEELPIVKGALDAQERAELAAGSAKTEQLLDCGRRCLQNAEEHGKSAAALRKSIMARVEAGQGGDDQVALDRALMWQEDGASMALRYMGQHFEREGTRA